MLSAGHRLTDSAAFRRTVRSGRRAGSSTLVVHLWVDGQAAPGPAQVGFTVSKAVGNAATRNRVKRRLRHLTREHLPSLEELPGRAALVVRALPASAEASYAALGADLGRTLERVSTA
ncbi:ribonuclease P protein component [Nocardioides renjunii]|uniref:ribonuclease P protein component n=1 Tax=Nocardioides renjunii TaxID=3095075 RepID=UPI002AFE3D31|nr:ribonuclease P protein component [Nocardioides sp. S-34]WQQ22382.1 ribonuclease P protein component [Nocardioides sp. S-34]